MKEADRGEGRLPITLPVSLVHRECCRPHQFQEIALDISLFTLYQFDFTFSLLMYELLVQHPSFSSKTGAKKYRKTKTKRILKGNVKGSSKQQNSEQLK